MRYTLLFRTRLAELQKSTFLMNAFFLMLSTFVVAGFGFIFWIVITRNYPSSTVGLAATLLSISGLLSMLSLAGFDVTLVRFLPKSDRRNDQINSGLLVVTLTSMTLSIAFVISLPLTSPQLTFVLHNAWYFAGFVFVTTVMSLNILTGAIFLAFKQARNILAINVLSSVLKVALPLLVVQGSVMKIFALVGVAQLVGLITSLAIMKVRLGHVFRLRIHMDILRIIRKYSLSVYASSILNLLPPTLLPLMIVHRLGAENAAHYYMAFTIASVLYTISYASMQSAFVEGSHDETAIKSHITKAVRLVAVLLVPAILIIIGLSDFILKVFGNEYAVSGGAALRLFALGAIPVAACSALGAIFKITRNLRGVIVMNIVYAGTILILSYLLIPSFGIIAVGWAWMLGNIAAAGTGLFLSRKRDLRLRRHR